MSMSKEVIVFWYPSPGSVFGGDDHHWVTTLWPPHQHLCVVGVGFDHGIGRDGLVLSQNLRLFLGYRFFENSPLPQRLLWVHMNTKTHPPANGLQDQSLGCGLVDGHEPRGEALVSVDAAELRHIAVADGYTPRHTWIEIVIHAHCKFAVLFGGTYNGARLGGVSVPGVVDTIGVTDGLDFPVTQVRKLPT